MYATLKKVHTLKQIVISKFAEIRLASVVLFEKLKAFRCVITFVFMSCISTVPDSIVENYYLSHLRLTWSDGADYCHSQYGTSLATIKSDEDAQTLFNLSISADIWIGLNVIGGVWSWSSGHPWYVAIFLQIAFVLQSICDVLVSSDCGLDGCGTLKYWSSPSPNGNGDCGFAASASKSLDSFVADNVCSGSKMIVCDINPSTMMSNTSNGGAHLIAMGAYNAACGWDETDPMYHCINDSHSQATYNTGYFEDDIAVRCCSDSTGYSPDCTAFAKNYNEAVAICANYGYRLCTYNEIANLITINTGCSFNCAYTWTSSQCSLQSTEMINTGKFTLS